MINRQKITFFYFIITIILLGILVFLPELKLLIAFLILVLFILWFIRKPDTWVGGVFFLLGFPLYINIKFIDRDIFILSTFIILTCFIIGAVRKQFKYEKGLIIPFGFIIFVYFLATLRYFSDTGTLLTSLRGLLGLASSFMFFLIIVTFVKNEKTLKKVAICILCMLTIQAILSIVQLQSVENFSKWFIAFSPRNVSLSPVYVGGVYRSKGVMGDYELITEWFVSGLVLVFAFLTYYKKITTLFLTSFVGVLMILGILVTGTRGGIIIASISLLIYLISLFFENYSKFIKFLLIIAICIILALPLFQIIPKFYETTLGRFELINFSLNTGKPFWETLPFIINRTNWLLIPSYVTKIRILGYGFYPIENFGYKGAGFLHSLYLTTNFQGGILGFVGWAGLSIYLLKTYHAVNIKHFSLSKILFLAILCGILAILINEFKVEFVRYEHTMQYFFGYLGCSVAAAKILTGSREKRHLKETI